MAGDQIEYTLTTSNTGNGDYNGYLITEDIGDILEYADVTDLGGASLKDGVLTWPGQDIPAGGIVVKKFSIKVKDPVPSTAKSTSDPLSFDLRMDNTYGQTVQIPVAPPVPKQIETKAGELPQTGAATSLVITCLFVALCVYFFLRNRQLTTEVQLLRAEYNPGV